MAPPSTIFQPSDLNRRGRTVLDAARQGVVRIRDVDGASLVVTREEELERLRDRIAEMGRLVEAMASFLTLARAVDHDHREPTLAELGAWTWVRHLPIEDSMEFVRDIGEALYASCRETSVVPLTSVLTEWKATAEALSDPLARETLLGAVGPTDFVEVERPEAAVEEAVGSSVS